ncbi:hypothetical protein UUU_35250 [Klebsiella pneumoniae subsp. pneumoniae DSM 30104 = JCM 1662 = NBRC 14940]|nr:hypothetical protein UUU_35250 [Klebsiella pneumoniae subsp. pneumoniae DSM 30104 = JCM 1662 = NBRC 14940]
MNGRDNIVYPLFFTDKRISAGICATLAIKEIVFCRNHNDNMAKLLLTQLLNDFNTAHNRNINIHNHHIRLVFRNSH